MDHPNAQWRDQVQRLRSHLFQRKVAPLQPAFRMYCRALAGPWADDLEQEALLRTFPALSDICSCIQSPKAYLFRTARNLWLDHRKRRTELLVADVPETVAPGLPPTRRELEDALSFLSATLTPRERDVYLLREVFRFTGKEAARLLGVTEAAVKMAASRARRRLADAPFAS
ncbi:MAG: RNA polymerase sigma factor [Myxococcota bacterium]